MLWRSLRRNRKATAGLVLLSFFLVLAIFPGELSPYNPTSITFEPGLGPSAAHWLGTTSQGQDILSQLIWGTRQTLIIALAAGGLATIISVIVGVSAAYLGGVATGSLSLHHRRPARHPDLPAHHRDRRLPARGRAGRHDHRARCPGMVLRRPATAGPGALPAPPRFPNGGQSAGGTAAPTSSWPRSSRR